METEKVEQDLGASVPNQSDSFVPPKDGVCFISKLPVELLCRIFVFSCATGHREDEFDWVADSDGLVECAEVDDEADTSVDMGNEFGGEEQRESEGEEVHNDEGREQGGEHEQEIASKEEHSDPSLSSGEGKDGDLYMTGDEPVSPYNSSNLFPFAISHVCRHWRDVALSNPSLWTNIEACPVKSRYSYGLESLMMERSRNSPINVLVECGHIHPYHAEAVNDSEATPLMPILVSRIHRWRTMVVSVSEHGPVYDFFSAPGISVPAAPQLTTLELYYNTEGREGFEGFRYFNMSKRLTLFSGSAPLLTKVVLWRVHVDWNQPWINSAPNLTELQLAFHAENVRPSWPQFVTIMRGAPALEKLYLRQSGPSAVPVNWFIEPVPGSPVDSSAPVELARLTDLIFALHLPLRAIRFIRRFHLPTLKNFTLELNYMDYAEFIRELATPATHLSPAQAQPRSLLSGLESLTIVRLPASIESIETLYGELQNLTSLTLYLRYLDPPFLDILGTRRTFPEPSGRCDVWLPRLTTLRVTMVRESLTDLREVVQKRIEAGVPLTSLSVRQYSEAVAEEIEWFRKNIIIFKFRDKY